MGLRFDPMGGGQFKQMVNALVEAERQPIKQMQNRKQIEEAKLKLFGEFKTKVSGLQSSLGGAVGQTKFRELKAELGDGKDLVEVTLDKEKAQVGSWEIEIKELAQRSSVITTAMTSPDEKILGVGYVKVALENGDTEDVYITEEEGSLNGLAARINAVPGGAVKATVIKDMTDPDQPYRMILTAKKDGLENEIEFPRFNLVDGEQEFDITEQKEALNALVAVDGYEIELEGNQVSDFFSGVGLKLKQARPGQSFTLSISPDFQKITDKVKKIIENVNGVLEFINKQNTVDEKTDTRSTFSGDTSLQNIEFRIRNLMHEGFAVHREDESVFRIVQLGEIGIEFDKAGKITLKEDKFTKAMEADYEAMADIFSGEMGFTAQLKQIVDSWTRPGDGLMNTRERGIQARIKQIDSQIESKERNVEKKTQSLTDQYSRLQGTLSNLQRQQSYLTATLGGGGGNPISQLLGG